MLDRLQKIRHDLDLFLPDGSYSLEYRPETRVRLVWDAELPGDLKHFAAEVLRVHGVPFETRTRSGPQRAGRAGVPRE